MIPVELRTRQCLIDDIKSLEIKLSHLQERFDLIVTWIRSQYTDLIGLPEHIVVAVLGTQGPSESLPENHITKREKLSPGETEAVDENASCLDENDAEQHLMLKLDESILKDIESGPVSRLRIQLRKHKLACRKISSNEESNRKERSFDPETTTKEAVEGEDVPFEKPFDEDSDNDSECDPLNYVHSTYEEANCGGNINEDPIILDAVVKIEPEDETTENELSTQIDSDFSDMEKSKEIEQNLPTNNFQNCENSLISNLSLDLSFEALNNSVGKGQLIFEKQRPRVKKTAKHIELSREKHLILDAFEYATMISSLPANRLTCAVCQKVFSTCRKVRRHEFEVHLTKEEQRKFKSRYKRGNVNEEKSLAVDSGTYEKPIQDQDVLASQQINHLPLEVITTVEESPTPQNNSVLSDVKPRTAERNFLCNKCGQSFKRMNALKRHDLAVHAKMKNFECQYCDAKFSFQWLKTKHESKHLGASKVTCDLCGFSFTCKSILKNHISGVHENNRPFQCHLCDKRFKTSSARNYHVNTHGNPNGRKRGLNREIDPMKAAAKRRHCPTWKKRRVEELTSLTAFSEPAGNECFDATTATEST